MPPSLEEATAHIQSGKLQPAQAVLAQLLREDIRNESAWFLLAQCVTDPNQRRQCLQRVVAINPSHALAQRLLNELNLPSTVTDSFQPREFELTAVTGSETEPTAPAFTPRPFALIESDVASPKRMKETFNPLPVWVRPPKLNS